MLSAQSIALMLGAFAGSLILPAVATATSTSLTMLVAGLVIAAGPFRLQRSCADRPPTTAYRSLPSSGPTRNLRWMEVVSTLRTTGAVRAFADEPVADAVVHEILDDARFAPSGGNRQPWRVAVVKEATIRRRLGELMQPVWDGYVARAALGITPYNWVDDREPPTVAPVPNALLDGIATIPVVLVVAADLRQIALMDAGLERPPLAGGASIYPFCWSILLAARARDLGGVLTTFLTRIEPAAAPTLGLPAHHALAAAIFLGVPERRVTKLRREPVETFTTVDRFDGAPFTL